MSEELQPWGKIQKRTFTRWVNVHLADRKLKIDDLESDFSDGFKLLNLLEIISGLKIQYNKNVKFYSQKLENVGKALKFVRDQGIKLVAIGPEDIVEKRIKLILGLIWTIILRYQINKVEYTPDASAGTKGVVQNQDLLQWVNSKVPEHPVKNFKADWKDGKVIYALANAVKPGLLDPAASASLAPVDRVTAAIDAAKTTLNIPQLIDANDMVSDHSDDLSVMTYVSYYRAYHAKAGIVDPNNSQVVGPGIKKAKANEDNIFNIIAKNAFNEPVQIGGSNFSVKVNPVNASDPPIAVTIKDNLNGQYQVHYTPNAPGKYTVDVTLDGAPVANSPYTVEAVPTVDAKNSGVTKAIYVGPDGLPHFEVTTRDKAGKPIFDAALPVVAAVSNIVDGTEAHATVTPKEDGVYDITIAPPKAGDYEIKVGLKDTDPDHLLGGKPFTAKLEPPAEKPKPISPADIFVDVPSQLVTNDDGEVQFYIKSKPDADIKSAKFNVNAVGPDSKPIDVSITALPDGSFLVTLAPTETGDHNIKIDFSDPSGQTAELPPFIAQFVVKPPEEEIPHALLNAAAKTKVDLSPISEGLDPMGNLHFKVLPEDLPDGAKIVPKLTLVGAGEIPVQVGEASSDSVGVSFHPPSSGEYEIEAFLEKDGKQAKVADTPKKFSVLLPKHVPAEEQVQKAAEETTVDFSGLSAEPTEDGGVSFNVNGGKRLPAGAKYNAKILFVPDHSTVPSTIFNEGDEGKFRVVFYPKHNEGPAEYLVALSLADKNGNDAKVRGGPYRVIVNIVRSPEFPNVNPRVVKVAKEASLDMKPLNSGPNPEGKLHFDIVNLPATLPKGSRIDAKITNTADGSDIPTELKHGEGACGVYFKPAGSGVYLIEAVLADEEDNGASFKGAPVRLTLNFGTAPPRSTNAPDPLVEKAAEESKVDLSNIGKGTNKDGDLEFTIDTPEIPEGAHLESAVVFVPDNLDLPSTLTPSPTEKGKHTVAFKPVRTGEYMIAANLVDKDGKTARLKGTPIRLMLTVAEPTGVPLRATANPKVREAADNSSVDLAPIGAGLNEAGQVKFYVNTKDIPADAVLAPKVAFNNQELPVVVRPVEGTDGKYSVEFPPSGSGEYLISANILDKEGLPAKIKGTPIRLNLKLPETQTLQRPRAPTPVLHPASPRLHDQLSSAPTQTASASSIPAQTSSAPTQSSSAPSHTDVTQRSHAHTPSPLAQSRTAGSLEETASPAQGSAESEPEEVDAEQTVMWTHSFQIEARTIRGTPRRTGGDVFAVAISGPNGPVDGGVKLDDLGNGKYQVTYSLPGHGKYSIRATINGRDIVGSPFTQKI
jgi:filamin